MNHIYMLGLITNRGMRERFLHFFREVVCAYPLEPSGYLAAFRVVEDHEAVAFPALPDFHASYSGGILQLKESEVIHVASKLFPWIEAALRVVLVAAIPQRASARAA